MGWEFDTGANADFCIDLENGTFSHDLFGGGTAEIKSIENSRILDGYGEDVVIGKSRNNEIWGGGGSNYVEGGGGDDVIYGGNYYPTEQPPFADGLMGYTYDFLSNSEKLSRSKGNDILFGSGTMSGGARDDTLNALSWDGHLLSGGAGADTFVFSGRAGNHDPKYSSGEAMSPTIRDFDPGAGDRFKILDSQLDWAPATYIGEANQFFDGAYGYWHDGADSIAYYNTTDDTWGENIGWGDLTSDGVTIRLEGYAGPITEDMFIMA